MNLNSSIVAAAGFGTAASASRGHGLGQKTLAAVASKLDMSSGEVTRALDSGESLTDLAREAGVGKDELVSTIASTLPSTGRDGSAVDTTALATRLADHVRAPRTAAPPATPAGSSGSPSGSPLGQGVDALSSALGISSDDLMQRLTDGTGISDLLAAKPELAAQLSLTGTKGALVDGYA